MYTAESTSVDCVVVRVNDFFKCGIKIGFRLLEKPHRKNSEVTKIKAKAVLPAVVLVVCVRVVFICSLIVFCVIS